MVTPDLHSRAGLTLLEVLLAVVLMTILAGTGISLLRDVRITRDGDRMPEQIRGDGSQTSFDLVDLERLADAFMADPQAFGVDSRFKQIDNVISIRWPDHPEWPEVSLNCLRPSESEGGEKEQTDDASDWALSKEQEECWVMFSCDVCTTVGPPIGSHAFRWLCIVDDEDR